MRVAVLVLIELSVPLLLLKLRSLVSVLLWWRLFWWDEM